MKTITTSLLLLFSVFHSYSQVPVRKILFIGIDGCRADALMAANTPAIDNLLTHAVYSTDGLCAYKTWSGNGWSSMLTGVWHTKHGVTDNSFAGSNYLSYPDFIARMESFDPALRTITSVHWDPINSTIINNADSENTYATDLEVKNGAVNALTNDNPDVLFVAFDDVDHAGHTYGFSPAIQQYIQAIEITAGYVGNIITALQNRPNYSNEDWLVVLTTDHGGTPAGHGGGTLEERTIFTIYSNPAFAPQQLSRQAITQPATYNEAHLASHTYAKPANQTPFLFGASQDFTIEFWVKPTAFTSDPAFISNKNWNSGLNAGFVISAQQSEYWKVNIGDGTDRLDIQGGYLLPGVWHHLAVSFDRDGLMTAYEDGVVVGFDKMQNIGNINTALPLVINQDGTTTYGYDIEASYKDIRVWNTVIPDSTLINWAAKPVTPSHPYYNQLLANWKCEDGAGTTLQDASPNANNCAVTGPLTWNNNQSTSFTVYDYSGTTREPDNAVTALTWMCVPIQPSWNLDGKSRVLPCGAAAPGFTTTVTNANATNSCGGKIKINLTGTFTDHPVIKLYDANGLLLNTVSLAASATSYTFSNVLSGKYTVKVYDNACCETVKAIQVKCPKPLAGFATTNITGGSAKINWTTVNCEAGYRIQYRKTGNTAWITKNAPVNTGFKTLTGLLPASVYEWRVATKCTNSNPVVISAYSSIQTFTTGTLRIGEEVEQSEMELHISPNPVAEVLLLTLKSDSPEALLKLINITGQTLLEKEVLTEDENNNMQLNVSGLAKGMYVLQVQTEKVICTKRFIKN